MFVSHFDKLRLEKAAASGYDISVRRVAIESGLSFNVIQKIRRNEFHRVNMESVHRLCVYFQVRSITDLVEFRADDAAA